MGSVTTTLKPSQGVAIRESGYGTRRRVVVEFKDHFIAGVDEASTVGKAVEELFKFPDGLINFEGAVAKINVKSKGGDGTTTGVFATWDGDFGLGTAIGAGATLASTEQNLIPTGSTTQAVSGATDIGAQSTDTEANKLLDGSSAPVGVFFNLLIDDGDQNIAGAAGSGVVVNGEIVVHFTNLGDKA